MTASTKALIVAITHANLASYRHWIALSARAFEQACAELQAASDACAEGQLAAIRTSTVWAAASTRAARTLMGGGPWLYGASCLGHPAMTCLVAEYADDMDPSTFATVREARDAGAGVRRAELSASTR